MRFWIYFGLVLTQTFALEITEDTFLTLEEDIRLDNEPISISKNVFWSVAAPTLFTQDAYLDEGASWFLSGINGDEFDMYSGGQGSSPTGAFVNKGLVAAVYDKVVIDWSIRSFENRGTMVFSTKADSSTALNAFEFTNYGNIVFKGGLSGLDNFGTISAYGEQAVINEGNVCAFDVYFITASIEGNGCVHIFGRTSAHNTASKRLVGFDKGNVFQFAPGSTGSYEIRSDGIVRGFGEGMHFLLEQESVWTYDGKYLKVTDINQSATNVVNIGPGYDESLFAASKYTINGWETDAIVYNGPVPSGAASDPRCGVCPTEEIKYPSPSLSISSTETATSTGNEGTLSSETGVATDSISVNDSTSSELLSESETTTSSEAPDTTKATNSDSDSVDTPTDAPTDSPTDIPTTAGSDDETGTGSGLVEATGDSEGSAEATSVTPGASEDHTTTWTTTDSDGQTVTGSGIVDVTTDSAGSVVVSTSTLPEESGEYTTTWTTTGTDGVVETGSGIVDVTTDSDGSVIVSTSTYPTESGEYTTTWTTTNSDGHTLTGSGIVEVITDSQGSVVVSTSTIPEASEEHTTTTDGPSLTGSGIESEASKSSGLTTLSTTEYTTTWTTTDTTGGVATASGIVSVVTDSKGLLVTSTSAFCTGCTVHPTTWTTTDSTGGVVTGTGIVSVTTNSEGSLTTSTISRRPTTWTTTDSRGSTVTGSGIVKSTTDSVGSVVVTTSTCPTGAGKVTASHSTTRPGCTACTMYTTAVTTQGTVTTCVVVVSTGEEGKLVTSTQPVSLAKPDRTQATIKGGVTTVTEEGSVITNGPPSPVTNGPSSPVTNGPSSLATNGPSSMVSVPAVQSLSSAHGVVHGLSSYFFAFALCLAF